MRHYRQLTQEERYQITALKGLGYTQRQIARETGRSPSTISWELRRNRGIEGYQAETAQRVAYRRRREAGKRHKRTPELIAWVEARLRDDWRPEQIAGSLREAGYPLVSHEWIYRHQACLRPRDRFCDIPVPKIDSAFDNIFVPQLSWSSSTTQQLRKLLN